MPERNGRSPFTIAAPAHWRASRTNMATGAVVDYNLFANRGESTMRFYRWGKPRQEDDQPIPITPPPELEQKYDMLIVTDTETYRVNEIPRSKCSYWAYQFGHDGALLEQGNEPILYIPARRILEIKFEKTGDAA